MNSKVRINWTEQIKWGIQQYGRGVPQSAYNYPEIVEVSSRNDDGTISVITSYNDFGTPMVVRVDPRSGFVQEIEDEPVVEVQFPIGALWTDAKPDDYLADATEIAYAETVRKTLWGHGYDVTVAWTNVISTTIVDASGDPVDDTRYDDIRTIIDDIEIEYISDRS